MKRRLGVLTALGIGLALSAGCGGGGGGSTPDDGMTTIGVYREIQPPASGTADPGAGDRVAPGLNSFAVALYRAGTVAGENAVISPLSSYRVAGMALAGAEGDTAEALLEALGLEPGDEAALGALGRLGIENEEAGFTSANAVWGHTGYRFSRTYLERLSELYSPVFSELEFKDLGALYPEQLAGWSDYLSDDDLGALGPTGEPLERTRLVMGSAAELTADWDDLSPTPFSALFERLDGRQFRVPMTRLTGTFGTYSGEQLSAVAVPLLDGELSLLMVTPAEDWFDAVEDSLETTLDTVAMYMTPEPTAVAIPHVELAGAQGLGALLARLGAGVASSEEQADFSAVNHLGHLFFDGGASDFRYQISGEGIFADSAAVASLVATEDEPEEVWGPGGSSNLHGSNWSSSSGSGYHSSVYVPEGSPDARPLLFAVRHSATGAILWLGRILDAGGEEAGTWRYLEDDAVLLDELLEEVFSLATNEGCSSTDLCRTASYGIGGYGADGNVVYCGETTDEAALEAAIQEYESQQREIEDLYYDGELSVLFYEEVSFEGFQYWWELVDGQCVR